MHSPPRLTSHILLAAAICCLAAIAPANCTVSGDRSDVISFSFPSFKGVDKSDDRFDLSWDAGIVDGALHLTVDDVNQPLVRYTPKKERPLGRIVLRPSILLSVGSYDDRQDATFNTSFTMSVSLSSNQAANKSDGRGLLFEVLPNILAGFSDDTYESLASVTSANISVDLGIHRIYNDYTGLYILITPATMPDAPPANYTVWIDYDGKGKMIWVYVDKANMPKPAQATLDALDISGIFSWSFYGNYFGLLASKNRTLPSCQPVIYSWNLTVQQLHQPERKTMARWFLAVMLCSVLVAAITATVLFFQKRIASAASSLASRFQALRMKMKLSRALRRLPGIPREFKYADVKKATRNFHESMRLGKGGFGAVYKGTIQISTTDDGEDGQRRRRLVDVAVKKFTRKEDRGYEDFLAEVAVINRLRHKNIVPLIGWCYESGKLLLLYQYMPNGSLDQHLFHENRHQHHPTLQWEQRYNVIRDVAAGLHYAHHEYERVVLHRDIKASNIMLDDGFGGRLGDFGLARVVGFNKNSITDMGVAGTWGFIAPEYAVSHRATRQTDVYAFGVLVLEIVTGRRSLRAADAPFPLLTDWVWWLHQEGRLLEAVDDVHAGEADQLDASDATRLLLLGLTCSNPKASDRPSMAEVVQVIAKSLPPPEVPVAKPTFLWPPDGELDQLMEDADDDLVGTAYDDYDWSHREVAQSHGGFVISIGSLEITVGRSRKLRSL